MGREREKKILVPNSVQTRLFMLDPGKKISKKIAKKLKKLKKSLYSIIIGQNMMERPRKKGKNFSPEFRSYSARARKLRKK